MTEPLFDLDGRVVVITGGTGFLGRQHAEIVAQYGATPVLLDLSSDEAKAVATGLTERYEVEALGIAVDITIEFEIQKCRDILLQRFGHIDVLINNAANNPTVGPTGEIQEASRLEDFGLDHWNQDIAVGLTGAFLCAKYFGPVLAKNPSGGSIINISSDLGLIAPDQRLYRQEGLPDEEQQVKPVTYSVVKTGLIGLTRYLATYWADKNVRCNAVCPGGVFNDQSDDFLDKVSALIPMGRMAQPDELQGVILFLASAASSYVNGAVIPVDGGRTVW